jgi:hypothetical protein
VDATRRVTGHADRRGVRQVLNDLNQRVRYALGEYDEPPTPVPRSDRSGAGSRSTQSITLYLTGVGPLALSRPMTSGATARFLVVRPLAASVHMLAVEPLEWSC